MTLLDPRQYRLHQVSTFYRRSALEKIGFKVREDLHYVMDRELLYRVCREFPVLLVQQVYGLFRKHSASKSEHAILPFAEEFASLYLQNMSGESSKDRLRVRYARYFRASGWIKFARGSQHRMDAFRALMQAVVLWPGFLFQYSFLKALFQVIR